MTNYLLIHGAMRGAWLWDRVMPLLMKAGANPIAIDLPGHGDRVTEGSFATMSTYIDDVIAFIRKENLKDLVLVGHSMSGIVISKVAEEVPERVRHLVYVGAVVAKNNEALIDLLTKERQETLKKLHGKVKEVFGTLDQLRPMYFTDMDGEERESYLRQLTPQPLAVFFEKVHFKQFPKIGIPMTYVLGRKDMSLPPELTRRFAERLGVTPLEIDAGHDMMVSRPGEVAKILLSLS